ncbi:MAG: 2'-5' RNA ligase family protein [Chitinophagaceae bacterium]|nr:MAG: 2'-5' RNA ligase family protein [Chitinophagaceae bacterium]
MTGFPLILTLQLNEEAFNYFNSLRQQYFPPERNFLSAHLTLFHHLPANETAIEEEINLLATQQTILSLAVIDVVSIGKGVAFKIECSALQKLQSRLQAKWNHCLTPQDKQKIWPHVTVQNKTTPAIASQTLEKLKAGFHPFTAFGTGFSLWEYEGGPWRFVKTFPFQNESSLLKEK